LTNLLQINIIS